MSLIINISEDDNKSDKPRYRVPARYSQTNETNLVSKGVASFDSPGSLLGFSTGYIPSDTGTPVTPFSAMQVATAYACCRVLAEDIAKLPIRLRRRQKGGGSVVDLDHPINRLLWRPNPWQTPFDFKSYLVYSLALVGNGYSYIVRSEKDGRPLGLIPITSLRVNPMIHHDGMLFYYVSHPMLDVDSVTMFDMIHIKNFCLDDGFVGVSPIAASQNSIGIATATQKAAALFYNQGTKPSGALKTKERLSLPAKTSLAQQFERNYAGVQNYSKIMVLEEGLEFQPISINPVDSQLLESRRFSVEEVCRIFRVPSFKVNDLARATFNNIESLTQQYVDDSLMPIANKIEQQFDLRLLFEDERDDYFFRFDFDELLRGDTKTRYEAYQIALLNGFMNQDEVRLKEGLAPIPDGKGKEFRVPLNTGTMDSIKPGSDLGKPTPPKPDGEVVQDDNTDNNEDKPKPKPKPKKPANAT